MKAVAETLRVAKAVPVARVLVAPRTFNSAGFTAKTGETQATTVRKAVTVQTEGYEGQLDEVPLPLTQMDSRAWIFAAAFALQRAIDSCKTRKTVARSVNAIT
jgi:hypothetical protein